jgi:hypothetical protein
MHDEPDPIQIATSIDRYSPRMTIKIPMPAGVKPFPGSVDEDAGDGETPDNPGNTHQPAFRGGKGRTR